MTDYQSIASTFVQHYYVTFDNSIARPGLASLYREESILVWENQQHKGAENIITALNRPEFKNVKTVITTADATPAPESGVLVAVTGRLCVDDNYDKPIVFASTFLLQLNPGQPGGYFIYSQTFRVIVDI
ncbi:hypothetical protein BDV27DRAFT_142237 [Aspergillus caelatus]|uniref:Nuclear transport factor 2 n=1 Tax=Aspergillus caelatus TaxID=61420 RepID=A0A5N7AFN9_9EURO|nr:uncharacterized protein BDV27DRAFT_142237 [Aspergillus caelatus]KAE8368138.1 hypothetical protein BDV27DRAFT_142237 [Aspergillus caelatus]